MNETDSKSEISRMFCRVSFQPVHWFVRYFADCWRSKTLSLHLPPGRWSLKTWYRQTSCQILWILFHFPDISVSCFVQWTAWTRCVPTTASVWTGSATVSPAGVGSTVSSPEPSARTSATATAPSYQTPACAAATPTGWGPTAPWVNAQHWEA